MGRRAFFYENREGVSVLVHENGNPVYFNDELERFSNTVADFMKLDYENWFENQIEGQSNPSYYIYGIMIAAIENNRLHIYNADLRGQWGDEFLNGRRSIMR